MSITYSVCVFVGLGFQHENGKHLASLPFAVSQDIPLFFHIIS